MDVQVMLEEFGETGNHLFLLEAFVASFRAGQKPPQAALAWLADGLEAWADSAGAQALEHCLHLRPPRGGRALFAEWDRRLANSVLLADMDVLVYLGATREQAAAIALDRRPNAGGAWQYEISAETLLRTYASRRRRTARERLQQLAGSPEAAAAFLGKFNPTYMPTRMHAMTRVR